MKQMDIQYIWTWTAAYEEETFYIKQGFEVFTRFDEFLLFRSCRVGVIKKLSHNKKENYRRFFGPRSKRAGSRSIVARGQIQAYSPGPVCPVRASFGVIRTRQ